MKIYKLWNGLNANDKHVCTKVHMYMPSSKDT